MSKSAELPQFKKSRRKVLQGLSLMLGTTVANSLLTGNAFSVAMAYSASAETSLKNGKVFSIAQLQLLENICAIVIPKTDTLGAAEVDTHGFIDNQLFHCYTKTEQEKTVALLSLIEQKSLAQFSLTFIKLANEQQFNLLTELDQGIRRFNQPQQADFKELKKLICFGYYTSEVGASQELRYVAIPGGFKGSIPYKKNQTSWGSQALFY
ncbi:MAG: gluconate 2-dehydrogenase subunit 3 family protein [Thalassotalea sp.]